MNQLLDGDWLETLISPTSWWFPVVVFALVVIFLLLTTFAALALFQVTCFSRPPRRDRATEQRLLQEEIERLKQNLKEVDPE